MAPGRSKFVFVVLAVGWYLIRYKYARRSNRTPVLRSARGPRETALLAISLTGLGVIPLFYIATAIPHFATYAPWPPQGWLGLLFAAASLLMFQLTHRALGRNWSVSLDVRENHRLITDGVYRRGGEPVLSSFSLLVAAP